PTLKPWAGSVQTLNATKGVTVSTAGLTVVGTLTLGGNSSLGAATNSVGTLNVAAGTLTMSGNNLTVTSGGATFTGSVTTGAGTLQVSGAASVDGGTVTYS